MVNSSTLVNISIINLSFKWIRFVNYTVDSVFGTNYKQEGVAILLLTCCELSGSSPGDPYIQIRLCVLLKANTTKQNDVFTFSAICHTSDEDHWSKDIMHTSCGAW